MEYCFVRVVFWGSFPMPEVERKQGMAVVNVRASYH